MSRCIFVLGMHRSGTSVLSRILNILGAEIPGTILGAAPDNPTGFWESAEVVAINDRILGAISRTWDCLDVDVERSRYEGAAIEFLTRTKSDLMLIKDPRLCRLVRPWGRSCQMASIEPLYIILERGEEAVTKSLFRRNGLPRAYGRMLREEHIEQAEKDTEGGTRIFTSYEEILSNPSWVAIKIAHFLSLPLAIEKVAEIDGFVDKKMNHVDLPNLSAA